MATRISDVDGMPLGAGSGKPVENVHATQATGSATAGSGTAAGPTADSVHITEGARALAALAAAVQSVPEVNAARVSTLQNAIDSGSYGVDPDRIASRLLQLEQELAGTHP